VAKYLSFKEVGELLHISRSRINQLLDSGDFPRPIKLAPGPGRVLWTEEAIAAWLASRAERATKQTA